MRCPVVLVGIAMPPVFFIRLLLIPLQSLCRLMRLQRKRIPIKTGSLFLLILDLEGKRKVLLKTPRFLDYSLVIYSPTIQVSRHYPFPVLFQPRLMY